MAICKCGKKFYQHSTVQSCCPSCQIQKATDKHSEKKTRFNFERKSGKSSEKTLARNRADKWFSRYIRLRDAIIDGNFAYCVCVTCSAKHDIKNIDCGHYLSRGNSSVRFDERNVGCQCKRDNRFMQGKHFEFEQYLIKKIGQDEVNELKELAKTPKTFTIDEYEQIALYYKNMVKLLQEKNSINIW